MIFLNQEKKSVITIDEDLVTNYKHSGDAYLIDIRRCLTKQLVWYVVYYDLQHVNDSYFTILKKLIKGKYTQIGQLQNDNKEFIKYCDLFLKNSKSKVPEDVFDMVKEDIDKLKLLIQKLIYICENICYDEKTEDL